jgi:hypothetical protein
MVDRAEPGVTPHPKLSQPWGDPDYDPTCAECREHRHGRYAIECGVMGICIRPKGHGGDHETTVDRALDAATPRPGLAERIEKFASLHRLQWSDDVIADLAAFLASGTGEPGLDGLADTSRIEIAINRFADAAKLPRPYCARYWGSDGTLCSTHHGRFPDPSAVRCDAHARLANDKGADPTPEPK